MTNDRAINEVQDRKKRTTNEVHDSHSARVRTNEEPKDVGERQQDVQEYFYDISPPPPEPPPPLQRPCPSIDAPPGLLPLSVSTASSDLMRSQCQDLVRARIPSPTQGTKLTDEKPPPPSNSTVVGSSDITYTKKHHELCGREGIATYSTNDVLCGRGSLTNRHSGNCFFRSLVQQNREKYLRSKRSDKTLIQLSIVHAIRQRNGKFLKKDKNLDLWFEISDEEARHKASQALRRGSLEFFVREKEEGEVHRAQQNNYFQALEQNQQNTHYPSSMHLSSERCSSASNTLATTAAPPLSLSMLTNNEPNNYFHAPGQNREEVICPRSLMYLTSEEPCRNTSNNASTRNTLSLTNQFRWNNSLPFLPQRNFITGTDFHRHHAHDTALLTQAQNQKYHWNFPPQVFWQRNMTITDTLLHEQAYNAASFAQAQQQNQQFHWNAATTSTAGTPAILPQTINLTPDTGDCTMTDTTLQRASYNISLSRAQELERSVEALRKEQESEEASLYLLEEKLDEIKRLRRML